MHNSIADHHMATNFCTFHEKYICHIVQNLVATTLLEFWWEQNEIFNEC